MSIKKKHKNFLETKFIDQLKVPKSEIFNLLDFCYFLHHITDSMSIE